MGKKVKFDINTVQYLLIRDLAFNYYVPEDVEFSDSPPKPTEFYLELVKMFSTEQRIVRLIITVHLTTESENKKEIKGSYTSEHLFQVNDLENWVTKTGDQFDVDNAVDVALTNLAYSTVRGSLYQKLSTTWFSDLVLPITRPADIA